jgi:hypothetical protein
MFPSRFSGRILVKGVVGRAIVRGESSLSGTKSTPLTTILDRTADVFFMTEIFR